MFVCQNLQVVNIVLILWYKYLTYIIHTSTDTVRFDRYNINWSNSLAIPIPTVTLESDIPITLNSTAIILLS